MDFILDVRSPDATVERHPILGPGGMRIRNTIQTYGIRPTYKVFWLDEPNVGLYVPKLWSKVYGPSEHFSEHFNLYYTSENCARKAFLASWRQEYLYNHGREHTASVDRQIEMMTLAYRDRNDPPFLVERNGIELTRFPISAYFLGGRFYLVQKL